MATNDYQVIFLCSFCKKHLNLESKTFPCLHSFCEKCLNKEVKRQTNGNGLCPRCHEIAKLDQLTLSPILVSYLKCLQMESAVWKCDLCLEDGNESIATNWCQNCDKFLCTRCNQFHNKLYRQHESIELAEITKEEIRKAMWTDMCKIHSKFEESYCNRCNKCFCDVCYTTHLEHSRGCSSRPLSVSEEALKKQTFQGPSLLQEINNMEKNLREKNEKSRIYCKQLKEQCDLKCEELWQNYEDIIDELREKTHEMCNELRRITKVQVEKWYELLDENRRMLKKLEIWQINVQHLLKKDQKEKDIVFGVELMARKLASSSPELYRKINEPVRIFQLRMKFSDYWLQFFEELKKEIIGSGFLEYSYDSIQFENEWDLPDFHGYRLISSIIVSEKDNHVFLADKWNCSVVEWKESGEFVGELNLRLAKDSFDPQEMFFSSSEILGVNCRVHSFRPAGSFNDFEEALIFLEREKIPPFLKMKKIIYKKRQSSYSVCQIKEKILICDISKFQFEFYTKTGEYITTFDHEEPKGVWPLIRADPLTGKFWGTILNTCKIFSFNENGQKLESFETNEEISDFSVTENGEIYFCNFEGISKFFPEKSLHKFPKKADIIPKIFVSKEKIFVCLKNDMKYTIKIFKFQKLIIKR